MRISDEHLEEWRTNGYTIVEGFLTTEELAICRVELERLFPTPQQYVTAPQLFDNHPTGGSAYDPPYCGEILNLIASHPDLVDFAERALRTPDLVLTRSTAWAKYAGVHDFEQSMHVDYMVDTLLYPSASNAPEQLTVILYYMDMAKDLGPTCIVPRDQTNGSPLVPYIRPRNQYPSLYESEHAVLAPAGSLLLYDLRTFHRGSGVTRPGSVRLTHHIAYRRGDAGWIGSTFWGNAGLAAEMEDMMERATPRQRALFGVPVPGHPYWNEETLVGMAARYPGMDMQPYLAAASISESAVRDARRHVARVPAPERWTRNTGVVTAFGRLREQFDAAYRNTPAAAAYWTGVLDFYETAEAASRPSADGYRRQLSWLA